MTADEKAGGGQSNKQNCLFHNYTSINSTDGAAEAAVSHSRRKLATAQSGSTIAGLSFWNGVQWLPATRIQDHPARLFDLQCICRAESLVNFPTTVNEEIHRITSVRAKYRCPEFPCSMSQSEDFRPIASVSVSSPPIWFMQIVAGELLRHRSRYSANPAPSHRQDRFGIRLQLGGAGPHPMLIEVFRKKCRDTAKCGPPCLFARIGHAPTHEVQP